MEASMSQKMGVLMSGLFRIKNKSYENYSHVSTLQTMISQVEVRIPASQGHCSVKGQRR